MRWIHTNDHQMRSYTTLRICIFLSIRNNLHKLFEVIQKCAKMNSHRSKSDQQQQQQPQQKTNKLKNTGSSPFRVQLLRIA